MGLAAAPGGGPVDAVAWDGVRVGNVCNYAIRNTSNNGLIYINDPCYDPRW